MNLTHQHLTRFKTDGYVVVENALTRDDLGLVISDYEGVVDRLARDLYARNRIGYLYEYEPFDTRLARICDEDEATYFESDNALDIGQVRGEGTFLFMRCRNLLDVVEDLVGPEICCSPMTHIRAKLPADETVGRNSNVVFWHQDAVFLHEEADDVFFVTAWIPLSDTTEENGCLRVMPGVHLNRTVYWDNQMPEGDVVSVPMKRGDVILIHKLTPHSSGPNRTDSIRWSMDVRYQMRGTPTGRSFWPSFDARSRHDPNCEISYATWRDAWIEALSAFPQKVSRPNRPTYPRPYLGDMGPVT
jgi:hypothetical protein